MSEDLLSIGAVVAVSGLPHSTLRFYEEAGLIRPARRESGRRYYEPSVVRRLKIIAHCQAVGFTIAEIVELLEGRRRRARWKTLAQAKLADLDAHIERAQVARRVLAEALECGCGDPASCELVTRSAGAGLLQIHSRSRR